MGILTKLKRPFTRIGRASKGGDDTADAVKKTVKSDFADAGSKVGRGFGRGIATPTSVGIVGGTGVLSAGYVLGERAKTEQQEEKSKRYSELQNRLDELRQQYANGNISKSEYERRKREAYNSYYASVGDETRGLSLTAFLAQLSTFQLLAVSGVAAVFTYFVLKPAVEKMDAPDLSPQTHLG